MAAAASFEKALVHARETEARTDELRAAIGLVRLRRLAGDPGTSRQVLVEVLGRYTEGDDIPPVVEARHLLAPG